MSGELLHPPQRIIQQLLVDLAVVTDPDDSLSWPCTVGSMPNTPDDAVVTHDTAGRIQGRDQVIGHLVEKYGIQIMIRSAGPEDGFVKANGIREALNVVNNVTVAIADETGTGATSYLVQTITPTSPILKLGPETPQSRRYLWTLNSVVSLRMLSA